MHARSALFDLYGDHLRARGGRAPVAALVRLLAPLDIAPPAVRTAISRMVRQGWLVPVQVHGGRGYALTERARHRLDDAATRIYRTREAGWDGGWDLLVLEPVRDRSTRERIRSGLGFLGYARLSDSTWISPHPSSEVDELLAGEQAAAARFTAYDDDPRERAKQAWDLATLAAAYSAWHEESRKLVEQPAAVLGRADFADDDEAGYVVRSHLVHSWRKFLFSDPGLPAELLPDDWPGHDAARFFTAEAERLLPAASRFVDRCLDPDQPDRDPDETGVDA